MKLWSAYWHVMLKLPVLKLLAVSSLLLLATGVGCSTGGGGGGLLGDAGPSSTPPGDDAGPGSAGNGNAGSGNAGAPSTAYAIAGYVHAGSVADVTVLAHAVEDDTTIVSAAIDDEGYFGLDLAQNEDWIVLQTQGGTAVDPSSGETVSLPTLRTLARPRASEFIGCTTMLTPLTELAFQLSEGDPANWGEALKFVSQMAGGANVACTRPDDPTSGDSTSRRATEYGIAIAALFAQAETAGTDLAALLSDLATTAAAGDASGMEDYLSSVADFLNSGANTTGIEAGATVLESTTPLIYLPVTVPVYSLSVAACGSTYNTNPALPNIGKTRTVKCDPPNTTLAVYQGHPAPPSGSECEPQDCAPREIVFGGSDVCVEAISPPQATPQGLKIYTLCNWYLDNDLTWQSACEEGLGLSAPSSIELPEVCDENCKPRLELVIPVDNNIDGSLIVHDGSNLLGLYNTEPVIIPLGPPHWIPCPTGGNCETVMTEDLAIGQGSTTRSFKLLTTYGYEWQVDFSVPLAVDTHTYCDVFSGQCTTMGDVPAPATGDCAALCDAIVSGCAGEDIDPNECNAECAKDQANAVSCGEDAAWAAMLDCCAGADFGPFCSEGGFDACQKGVCEDLRPAGAADGCGTP